MQGTLQSVNVAKNFDDLAIGEPFVLHLDTERSLKTVRRSIYTKISTFSIKAISPSSVAGMRFNKSDIINPNVLYPRVVIKL